MKRPLVRICVLGALATLLSLTSLQADQVFFAGTGHDYEVILLPQQITWEEAQADATARGGYLATILTDEENSFVFGLINDATYWRNGGTNSFGPWIGGYQPPGSPEPDGGWTWVNGDGSFGAGSGGYSNWAPGALNDFGGVESWAHFFAFGNDVISAQWNDLSSCCEQPIAYVVEYLDSDGDSLPDSWETKGITVDGAGNITPGNTGDGEFIDLPAMGANRLHHDVFVHADWMDPDPNKPGSQIKPSAESMQIPMDSFAAAPVSNPDGLTGINLHIDVGPDSVMNPVTRLPWGDDLSRAGAQVFKVATNPDELAARKLTHFEPAKRTSVFHYAFFCNSYITPKGASSGVSLGIPGTDFLVALGLMDETPRHDPPGGTVNEQAGTFIHELGHNLGLRHGGNEDVQYKPNYLSVMNYRFQFAGVLLANPFANVGRRFDYSRQALGPLNKEHLIEAIGINDPVGHYTLWSCQDPDGTSSDYYKMFFPALNWDLDDGIDPDPVPADINCDSITGDSSTILFGFNDWPALVYDGGGAIGTQAAVRRIEAPSDSTDEPTVDEIINSVPTELLDEEALAPHDVVTASPTTGLAPLTVNFDGSASIAAEGSIVDWLWEFGDGTTASGPTAVHQYDTPGVYFANLTVLDENGHSNLVPVFHRVTVPTPFQITSAVSRRAHGTVGSFDVDLPVDGVPGVECRGVDGKLTLLLSLTNLVVSGSASVTGGTATVSGDPIISGTTVTLNLSGAADVQTIVVALSGLTDVFGQVLADTEISMNVLVGDVDANKKVAKPDFTSVKTEQGQPIDASNFRNDIDANGVIDRNDGLAVKTRKGHRIR